MEWPLTSLVPSTLELSKFWHSSWPNIWWYPYWYLGVPYRYLTGPIVPLLLSRLQALFPSISYDILYITVIVFVWVLGGSGVWMFVRALGGSRFKQLLSFILFISIPIHIIVFSFGNGVHHLALSLTPWFFFIFIKSLVKNHRVYLLLSTLLSSLIILIDPGTILTVIIGMTILIFLCRAKKPLEQGCIDGILILITSLSLATVWYTPQYWWVLLGNPSFGGKPLSNVIPWVFEIAKAFIPILAALWVAKKKWHFTGYLTPFALLFFLSFAFLTVIRFLSDFDFWMDWSAYGLELQFALSLVLPQLLATNRYAKRSFVIVLTICILTIVDAFLVGKLFISTSLTDNVYKHKISAIISHVTDSERIFVSGSPVFWLNHALPTPKYQVRGAKDEVSTHATWAMGAYYLREGTSQEMVNAWMKTLGVSRVLLHTTGSREYFRDFKHPELYANLLHLINNNEDVFLRTDNALAYTTDRDILSLKKPGGGGDREIVTRYASLLKKPIDIVYKSPSLLSVSIPAGMTEEEVVAILVSFNSHWKIKQGEGSLNSDAFGNMVLVPKSEGEFILSYEESLASFIPGLILSVISLASLTIRPRPYHIFENKLKSISVTTKDEEEDY